MMCGILNEAIYAGENRAHQPLTWQNKPVPLDFLSLADDDSAQTAK